MPWKPDSISQRRKKAMGRGAFDADYERRRMADPALAEAERIRNTARWRAVRKIKLAQDPLCQDCIEQDLVVPATQVHHLEPLVRRPDLAYSMENLLSVCTMHHARREAEERKR